MHHKAERKTICQVAVIFTIPFLGGRVDNSFPGGSCAAQNKLQRQQKQTSKQTGKKGKEKRKKTPKRMKMQVEEVTTNEREGDLDSVWPR